MNPNLLLFWILGVPIIAFFSGYLGGYYAGKKAGIKQAKRGR